MNRRGQGTEMIGLVVIILLLVLIGAFYIRFASKPAPDYRASEGVKIQAEQYLEALSMLTLCQGKDMEDAMKACASESSAMVCGKGSCEIVQETAENTLNTLFPEKFEAGLIRFTLQDAPPGEEPGEIFVEMPGEGYDCEATGNPETYEKKNLYVGAYAVLAWCGS